MIVVAAIIACASSEQAPFFWKGVDMSQLSTEDAGGAQPPFAVAANASKEDALAILRAHGANAFRMRLWNQPTAQYDYANATGMLQIARRCKQHNLSFILDLHYSDWWADPGKQNKPAAWASLSSPALLDAVFQFTKSIVKQLVDQGTPPVAVQIGNEVSNGFLWAPKGQPCNSGGYLGAGCKENNWPMFAQLIARGMDGVKSACTDCLIAIHTDLGNHIQDRGIDYVIAWYKNLTTFLPPGHDFDLAGLSLYPQWDGGQTLQNIAKLPALASALGRRRIYIAETAYPADGTKQPEPKYAPSPTGQQQFLRAVISAVKAVPGSCGVLWWEGSEHGWNSLFDEKYVARPALLTGFRE